MYLKSGNRIIILIGKLHSNYDYWLRISELQMDGLDKVIIYKHVFLQIRTSVLKNVNRETYLSGSMYLDEAHYHMLLGAGGDILSIAFDECAVSTSIEVKFNDILTESKIQI